VSKFPLTVVGAEKLRVELQHLKSVERPAVIQAIAEARAQGDLSENAEYDAAKEKQGFIEGRIADLEGKLSNAQIIDPPRWMRMAASFSAPRSNWKTSNRAIPSRIRSSATTRPTSSRARFQSHPRSHAR